MLYRKAITSLIIMLPLQHVAQTHACGKTCIQCVRTTHIDVAMLNLPHQGDQPLPKLWIFVTKRFLVPCVLLNASSSKTTPSERHEGARSEGATGHCIAGPLDAFGPKVCTGDDLKSTLIGNLIAGLPRLSQLPQHMVGMHICQNTEGKQSHADPHPWARKALSCGEEATTKQQVKGL